MRTGAVSGNPSYFCLHFHFMEGSGYVLLILCFLTECYSTHDCIGLHVSALIPARSGSKGIRNKNLSRIGNETLLGRTIRVLKDCDKFDSIWVSTDGKKIAEEAVQQNVNVFWRDLKTATDNATTISAVIDFVKRNSDPDIIGVVQCTSPFIKKEYLLSAFEKISKKDVDCVFSVSRSHQLRWANKQGKTSPLNFDPEKRPRRQDWDGEFVENGMFYFAKRELILSKGVLQNDKCDVVEVPKKYSLEIDDEYDLMLARDMLRYFDA